MAQQELRTSQIIVPHGPGSLYFSSRGIPFIVGGLDFWFREHTADEEESSDAGKYELHEERLSDLLNVKHFIRPPTFIRGRTKKLGDSNRALPMLRFPSWYRNVRDGQLAKHSVYESNDPKREKGKLWQPVRYVVICELGHIDDFPWKEYIGCRCTGNENLYLRDDGASDLRTVAVRCCSCPPDSPGSKWTSLAGAIGVPVPKPHSVSIDGRENIRCCGRRPWLGEEHDAQKCDKQCIGVLINQTNIYYPHIFSAISVPSVTFDDDDLIEAENLLLGNEEDFILALKMWKKGRETYAIQYLQDVFRYGSEHLDEERIRKIMERRSRGPSEIQLNSDLAPTDAESKYERYRRLERNILRQDDVRSAVKDMPLIVRKVDVSDELSPWIQRVRIVDQLAETKVFCGFDRLAPRKRDPQDQAQLALQQLFLRPPSGNKTWLPAIRVYGEGIYIELDDRKIQQWQLEQQTWLRQRFNPDYCKKIMSHPAFIAPTRTSKQLDWVTRFHLVHTFSHLLINELVFYCGYGASSLRERLFVSADAKAPMASLLIYTTAGDMFGTLGGLVELGRPEQLGHIVRRALDKARWCSSDPVCSHAISSQYHRNITSLAACHSCALVPEVSCETMNNGIDRAVLVGLPDDREVGFFRDLL